MLSPVDENLQNLMKNKSKSNHSCTVCGDEAYIIRYGALACNSCKSFFRRYAFKSEIVSQCQYGQQCVVNLLTRRCCIPCRLRKCFTVGMSSQFIRDIPEHIKRDQSFKKKSYDNQLVPVTSPMLTPTIIPTLDLLNRNRSNLNSCDWTLLSNVVHAFDTFSSITYIAHIMKQLEISPVECASNSVQLLEAVPIIVKSIQSFICSLPDFQILTLNEQHSLLKRNLQGTAGFSSSLVTRDAGLLSNSRFNQAVIKSYGTEVMSRVKRLEDQLDPDSTLIKLMLVILALSSNCFVINLPKNISYDSLLFGTFRLYGSQNVYVELLWKYMLYRYGYDDTVIRFAALIKQALDSIDHLMKTYKTNRTLQMLTDNAFDEDKHSFVTHLNVNVPLWGNL